MASTSLKAIVRKNVVTWTEHPCKHIQVSGCRKCLNQVLKGSKHTSGVQCELVGDLLYLVAQIKKEVEGLRSIREREREIDWCYTLRSLQERHQGDTLLVAMDPLLFCLQLEKGDLRDREVPAHGGRQSFSLPVSPSQVLLHNRYETLGLKGQVSEDVDRSLSRGLSRVSQSTPHLKTSFFSSWQRVIVIGNSLKSETQRT